jgi:hypothetical protein
MPTLDEYRQTLQDIDTEIEEVERMTTYRERHLAGLTSPDPEVRAKAETKAGGPPTDPDPNALPARHAPLDELATARGIIWRGEELTVAEKQDQLKAALDS